VILNSYIKFIYILNNIIYNMVNANDWIEYDDKIEQLLFRFSEEGVFEIEEYNRTKEPLDTNSEEHTKWIFSAMNLLMTKILTKK